MKLIIKFIFFMCEEVTDASSVTNQNPRQAAFCVDAIRRIFTSAHCSLVV